MINILLLHLIKVTNILELTLKMFPWISIEMQVFRVRVTIGGIWSSSAGSISFK
jgi:hypothetical protein